MNEVQKQIDAAETVLKEQHALAIELTDMTDTKLIMLMLGDLLHALEIQHPTPNVHRLAVITEVHLRTNQ